MRIAHRGLFLRSAQKTAETFFDLSKTEKENQLLSELKSLEENDLRWEQKLIALSECTPQGIVLSEINADEGTVHITGTADSPVTAMRFQKELEKAWGGKTYIEKQKREPNLKMAVFTLLWKGGQP